MAPCILLCFSNTGVSVVTGDEQCHNLLIQNSELCYQSSLLPTYVGRWPTHTIVGLHIQLGICLEVGHIGGLQQGSRWSHLSLQASSRSLNLPTGWRKLEAEGEEKMTWGEEEGKEMWNFGGL